MAIDRRKKILKHLRLIRYDAFEKVCEQLGITYTFPPEYYRRATRRWMAKKEFCIKVANKWSCYLLNLHHLCTLMYTHICWEKLKTFHYTQV